MSEEMPTGSDPKREWAAPTADDRVVDRSGSTTAGSGGWSGGSGLVGWLRGRRVWVVGVVVVALVVGGVVVLSGGSAGAGEVILESSAAAGEDPFFDSIATSSVEVASGDVEAVAGDPAGVEAIDGSTPGLYGGTGEDACDAGALVEFLEKNPAKAEAFAGVLGIRVSGIADYVAGLTPVVLREDTRVTNHGFSGGEATARQSVLQAGTAVLVDARGVPRVRCACGNPLTEPAATDAAPTFEGDAWAGFDDTRLVAVAPAPEALDSFDVVDVTTDETYTQPVGVSVGAGLTIDQLLNVEVPFFCDTGGTDEQLVRLQDGLYECPAPPAGRTNTPSFKIWIGGKNPEFEDPGEPTAVVGDLTGDGANEGAIVAQANVGTAALGPTYAMVFSSAGDHLLTLGGYTHAGGGDEFLPGRPSDVRITDGVVEFTGVEAGECGACPPGPPFTRRFRLEGGQLVPATDGDSASTEALEGEEAVIERYLDRQGEEYPGQMCASLPDAEFRLWQRNQWRQVPPCVLPESGPPELDTRVWSVAENNTGSLVHYFELGITSGGGWKVVDYYVFDRANPTAKCVPYWVRFNLGRDERAAVKQC